MRPVSRSSAMTLKVCLRSAPMLSGCFHSCPSILWMADFAPGTTGPSTAVVTKTRLPQTTGLEWPLPGSGVFQRTFFASPHSSGRPFSAETPEPSGPRHCGQFGSPAAEVGETESTTAVRRRAKRAKEILADGFTMYVPLTTGDGRRLSFCRPLPVVSWLISGLLDGL